MPKIECMHCQKEINIEEKDFIIEDKRYYHKRCYISHAKKENKAKIIPKLKKFSTYFSILLIILIILNVFLDLSNPFLVFSVYITMVLTISFGIMTVALLIQLNRLK